MVNYTTFCKRYELDANSLKARREYEEYKYQLQRLSNACKTDVLYREKDHIPFNTDNLRSKKSI